MAAPSLVARAWARVRFWASKLMLLAFRPVDLAFVYKVAREAGPSSYVRWP